MARIRTIKPEFWSDEKMAELDPITRLVFLGLIGMADDCGRLLDNVKVIDAFIFPTTSDTCRESVATLSRMCRIRRGTTSSGQKIIQIANWERHQKVDKPNVMAALPEIYDEYVDTSIRESVANESRDIRDVVAPLPTTNDHLPTTNDRRPICALSEKFARFWDSFTPVRKTDKAKASKAFSVAAKKIDPEEIIAASIEYAASPVGMSDYAKAPTSWLNGECWNDDRKAWQRGNSTNERNGNGIKQGPGQRHEAQPAARGEM